MGCVRRLQRDEVPWDSSADLSGETVWPGSERTYHGAAGVASGVIPR